MPKDEFDPDDPMELFGVGLVTDEDTTDAMAECFVEEFLRLGHNHKQILALFRNPFYIGMNRVLQNRGEQYVRDVITEVFARWGKAISWSNQNAISLTPALSHGERENLSQRADESNGTQIGPTRPPLSPFHEPTHPFPSQEGTRQSGQATKFPSSEGCRGGFMVAMPGVETLEALPGGKNQGEGEKRAHQSAASEPSEFIELDPTVSDPMGGAIPKLDL